MNRKPKIKRSFSPSVNIIRDFNLNLDYIPTENAIDIFNNIIDNYNKGFRAFYLVGSYGTGKSSFLWALEKSLNGKRKIFSFKKDFISNIKSFETILIVGEYSSLIDTFAEISGIDKRKDFKPKEVIFSLKQKIQKLKKEKKGILILIDEFGKYLEFASRNNPSQEIYFIQQLTELINDSNQNSILITTLHQDFSTYSYELTKSQREEWDKVKGRFKELPFNEQVEHILLLATKRIQEFNFKKNVKKEDFVTLVRCANKYKAFSFDSLSDVEKASKLYPLDVLSAAVLTLSLQKYGQNERSLFSFLESEDKKSLKNFNQKENPFYNLSLVYDYLSFHFFSFIASKDNPDYTHWTSIKYALERAEGLFGNDFSNMSKIIKTIGLLNIFSMKSAKLDKNFIDLYGKICLGIDNPLELIKKLEQRKIIRYLEFASKFVLFEGTDLDIELALREAFNKVDPVKNVVPYLNKYFSYEIPAKSYFYRTGTPRIFKFILSEEPLLNLIPENEIDGFINLIFSENLSPEFISNESRSCEEAVLFGYFKNTGEIKNQIFEINKILKIKDENRDDKVAIKELDLLLDYYAERLNMFVLDNIYSSESNIDWFFKGKLVNKKIKDRKSFNKFLSEICFDVYEKTIIYKNEMINRSKLSSPINTAKKSYFIHLLNHSSEKDFGFNENNYPPQRTIFLSLLKDTGIHSIEHGTYEFKEPIEPGFQMLWKECEEFLEKTRSSPKPLNELYDLLLKRPYKLKKGFLEFWVPTFLYIKRTDFALYNNNIFIPDFNYEIIEVINKNPHTFFVKAFNIEGVRLDLFNKYRELIGQEKNTQITQQSFIDIIKPFLVFYRQLNEYARNTKRISNTTLAFRNVILNATDPEKVFFEDFPEALGYDLNKLRQDRKLLEDYMNDLRNSIKELRTCFDNLVDRIFYAINIYLYDDEIGFFDFKLKLIERYRNIKEYLLLPEQKSFLNRMSSDIQEKSSWLSSLVYTVFNKHLDVISDNEEEIIIDRLKSKFKELDNLIEFSELNVDIDKEEIARIEINKFGTPLKTYIIRYPKTRNDAINELYQNIKNQFLGNEDIDKAVLLKLLKEYYSGEEN